MIKVPGVPVYVVIKTQQDDDQEARYRYCQSEKRSSKNQGHQEVIGGHGWTSTAMDVLISVQWCVFSDIVGTYILDNEMQVWWTLVGGTGKVNVTSTIYFLGFIANYQVLT